MGSEHGKPYLTPEELLDHHKVILQELQDAYAKREQADYEYKRLMLKANAMYVPNTRIGQALGITETAVRTMLLRLQKGSKGYRSSGYKA